NRQAEEARRLSEDQTPRGAEERRRRENTVLGRVIVDVNASVNLESVLEQVAEGARELSGSDVVGIALRESDSDAMIVHYSTDGHGVHIAAPRVGGGPGLAAKVMALGRAVRTDRHTSHPILSEADVAAVEHDAISSLLAVPIVVGDRVEGILYVGNQHPRVLT